MCLNKCIAATAHLSDDNKRAGCFQDGGICTHLCINISYVGTEILDIREHQVLASKIKCQCLYLSVRKESCA